MTNGSKNDLGVECTAQNNINIAYFNTTMYNAKGKRRKEWKRMWNFDRDNHRSPWSLCALCCVTRECFKKEEELQLKHTETISIEQSKCFSSPLPSFPLSKFALVFRLNLNFHSVSVWLSVCVCDVIQSLLNIECAVAQVSLIEKCQVYLIKLIIAFRSL